MKKILFCLSLAVIFAATPALAATKTTAAKPAPYKPAVPEGYTSITWASAPGVNSYFKAPADSGSLDFLTRIYLPQNRIKFIVSTTTPVDAGPAGAGFEEVIPPNSLTAAIASAKVIRNLSFMRLGSEVAKQLTPDVKFLWDAPFFNMKSPFSELSMALKYSFGATTTISSGSRSVPDMNMGRRMLIIDNKKGTAAIGDFDAQKFVDDKNGDQALEGFSPLVDKRDNTGAAAARLFLGVSDDGKELVVYCSQAATIAEASAALEAAGVKPEHQLEADGGGSASCGYNIPGQYFVEPNRSLPVMMGAVSFLGRGTVNTAVLNVRKGPSTKNSVVKQIVKGDGVEIYEESNGWYRIGEELWVFGTLIKKN